MGDRRQGQVGGVRDGCGGVLNLTRGEGGGPVGTLSDDTAGSRAGIGPDGAADGGVGTERASAAEARMRAFIGPADGTTLRALRRLRGDNRAHLDALLNRDDSVLTAPGRDIPSVRDLDGTSRGGRGGETRRRR